MRWRSGIVLVAVLLLFGCATVPPSSNPKAQAKMAEADRSLDVVNMELQKFYADFQSLRQQIASFSREPGWPEMKKLLEEDPSLIETPDPFAGLEAKLETADWTRKWKAPWQSLFTRYLALVDRCAGMEVRRAALRSDFTSIQARYAYVSVSELSINRYQPGKTAYDMMELISASLNELDSYPLNAIGLYNVE
jgi:hypothetical protein